MIMNIRQKAGRQIIINIKQITGRGAMGFSAVSDRHGQRKLPSAVDACLDLHKTSHHQLGTGGGGNQRDLLPPAEQLATDRQERRGSHFFEMHTARLRWGVPIQQSCSCSWLNYFSHKTKPKTMNLGKELVDMSWGGGRNRKGLKGKKSRSEEREVRTHQIREIVKISQ